MARRYNITARDLECMLCDEMAEPNALPLSLLKKITNDFSDEQKIGSGGFAVVYKGKLENKTVAVKRMSNTYKYEKEFQREVACLMMVKHINIVKFLGYCADTQGATARYEGKFVMADVQQRLLCFEYLPKGSLQEYITDASIGLQWRYRYRIIKGVCQGLNYLHLKNIVHLDLKPANILLDDNLVAKITDFGLSRCFDEMESRVKTLNIGGTLGYLAPEFGNGELTYKFDIYSLGVIILEILTGKKGYQDVDKVVESWSNMLDKSHIEVEQQQVRVCAQIGIECSNFNPTERPDTQHIISRLDKTESINGYVETSELISHQVVESWSKSQREVQKEQVRVDKTKTTDGYIETGASTSKQLVKWDVVFMVRNEQGYELKQLRDQNNLRGSLEIIGLEKVTSKDEALEANLAAKRLTKLTLKWDSYNGTCNPEVEAEVLEGLCPPVGLKILIIKGYRGLRYPKWMVGKESGSPKDLQELELHTDGDGPAPQFVETFPHLRLLELGGGSWDALPDNMEHLTSLKKLYIVRCENIQSLPTLPRSLEVFLLGYCNDELMKSCQTYGTPNWQKIKHIPTKKVIGLSSKIVIPIWCPDFHFASTTDVLLLNYVYIWPPLDPIATDRMQTKIWSGTNRLRCLWPRNTA